MYRLLVILGLLALTPIASHAQVIVLGGGAGKECFRTVKLTPFPEHRDEKVCTEAIESGALDRANLGATLINLSLIHI